MENRESGGGMPGKTRGAVPALEAGLYMVSVPIGAARDITLRALDVLAAADVIAAEDTRSMRRLMEIHGIPLGDRPLLAYHDHNGAKMRPRLLGLLAEGRSIAYASEAGTPLVADPGFDLARAARAEGHMVTAAPGASAVLTALTVSAMPSDRFLFAGFLPNAKGARTAALKELADIPATLIFYESPKRIAATLRDAAQVMGEDRQGALCRELTKKFEEVRRAPLSELAASLAQTPVKGEIVLLVDRKHSVNINEVDIESELRDALKTLSVRDAADLVAKAHDLPRRQV